MHSFSLGRKVPLSLNGNGSTSNPRHLSKRPPARESTSAVATGSRTDLSTSPGSSWTMMGLLAGSDAAAGGNSVDDLGGEEDMVDDGLEVGKMTASPPRALMLRSSESGERLMTSPLSDEEAAKQSDPLGTDPMVGREQEQ